MIRPTPRPLPRRRLEKFVRGLRERKSSSAQKMAEEIGRLNSTRQTLVDEHEAAEAEVALQFRQQRQASTTEWDQQRHALWDKSESISYSAVFDTSRQEAVKRRSAKQDIEATDAEAKKRAAELEKRFLKTKEVPLQRLKATRQAIAARTQQLDAAQGRADSALAQRSLGVPASNLSPLPAPSHSDSTSALQSLQQVVLEAEQSCERLANQPLAKALESIWTWLAGGLAMVLVAGGLAASGVLEFLPAVLVGCMFAVVLLLGGLLGIRPWLKRAAAAEYPRVMQYVQHGKAVAEVAERRAVEENDAELHRLAKKRDDRIAEIRQWRDEQLREIQRKLNLDITRLHDQAEESKRVAAESLTNGLVSTDQVFEQRLDGQEQSNEARLAELQDVLEKQKADIEARIDELRLGGERRLRVATDKAQQILLHSQQWCQQHFPAWETILQAWPETLAQPQLPTGLLPASKVMPQLPQPRGTESTPTSMADETAATGERMNVPTQTSAAEPIRTPVLFTPLQDHYLTITGDPASPAVQGLIRNLVMRALTTLPPGKTQVCVIDPPGLGRDFGWLMHLADFDAQLVSHRVWTQPNHISKQIAELALAAEDFIQQSLRNQYRDIVEYNAEAGAMAEPFRLLVWSSLPSGMDDRAWSSLQSLLDTGARCGIIPILAIDSAAAWPTPDQYGTLMRRGMHLEQIGSSDQFRLLGGDFDDLPIDPLPVAGEELSQQIIGEVGRRSLLSHRVEVPLESMVPPRDQWWQADSSNCLDIPIGQSGVGRTHPLRLGVGTAQHAIIAGKTGSGKSSLLHAMITSAIVKYSPERLRLVLLDFKKGVEFQVYAQAAIAHADIIGIESHREFGLSALEYLDQCMQRRGEAFRAAGVQDLASWNALHAEEIYPRILLVIDEFQELFVEDDKLSSQASLLLDRIVRQGRSFGVHAVLSSQTLAGAYSLPRTTLGQMAVRIALQCDPSDAQIIFADDNPAAVRLKHPGQAVYNDAGGRIEGNQPMQIGWMPKATQLAWFDALEKGYRNADPTTNRLGRTVVYDGNRAAAWDENNADLAVRYAKQDINSDATWCVAGESVAISPAVVLPLTNQAGRNLLIVGADDAQAAAVLESITASFVRDHRMGSRHPQVWCVQASKPTDARTLQLTKRWSAGDVETRIEDSRGAAQLLAAAYEELQRRLAPETSAEAQLENPSETSAENPLDVEPFPLLVHLLQLGRVRELRREDDFGMGGFGETELTPDKHLEELLKDGPSHGIHVCIWADGYSTINRWLSRSALREIEIRMLMQMSANDSTNLVDSIAASRLGDHVMLLFDEATGLDQRFRPFAVESLDRIEAWQSRLDE